MINADTWIKIQTFAEHIANDVCCFGGWVYTERHGNLPRTATKDSHQSPFPLPNRQHFEAIHGRRRVQRNVAIEQTRYKRAPQPLEVQINTGGSRIEGIARIEGQPARPGMLVVLAPPPTRRQNRALYKVAFTDSDGRFVFRGVPPDEFKLFAWNVTPIGAYKNDAFLARFESSGQTVRVPQDTTVTVPVSIVESYFAR